MCHRDVFLSTTRSAHRAKETSMSTKYRRQAVRASERPFGLLQAAALVFGIIAAFVVLKVGMNALKVDTTPAGYPAPIYADSQDKAAIDRQMSCHDNILAQYADGSLTDRRVAEALGEVAKGTACK